MAWLKSFAVFIVYSFLLVLVGALPSNLEERGSSGSVSSDLLNQFSYIEQYAAAAYCSNNHSPGSSNAIACGANNCPLVQSSGATTVLEFQNMGAADCTGFIAVDKQNKMVVLSFRGSESLGSWIGDVNLNLASWSSCCAGCSVHAGFLDSWSSSKAVIVPALKQAISQNPGFRVIATGHSLGGAIATLAVAELRAQGINIALFTYGSPMVGNDAFASYVTAQQGGNYRITHASDIVPKLPGYLLGYRHVASEYWITAPENAQVTTSSIKISSGTMDLSGSCGQIWSTLTDHLWYFNFIGGCILSDFELKKRHLNQADALTYISGEES